jgi:hypothetical protein
MALKTPVEIDGKTWSLFKDYDKPHYHYLSSNGKVEYLEKRAQLTLLGPLEEIKLNVLGKKTDEYYWLCVVTLVCCGIEATGGYLIGRDGKVAGRKGTSRNAFEKFIHRYMPSYRPYAHALWKFFRNGLAHGSCIPKGGVELKLQQPIQRTAGIGIQINGDEFVDNFSAGFLMFIQDLKSAALNSKMRKHFETAWNWVFMS